MASIRKLPTGRWQVRSRERPGGPQTAKNFDRRRDGERFMKTVEADLLRGTYVDPTLGDVSLVDVMSDFIDQQPYRSNTRRNALYALEHVRRHFGDQPISRVRTSELKAFVTGLQLEPRSVQSIWQYVGATIHAAHLDGVIGRDPTQRVKLPQHDGTEIVVPVVGDVMKLMEAAPADFMAAVVLGGGLGLRAGVLAGLTEDRIDWLRREVKIDRQWHGKLDRFEPVKSKASNRSVPASDRVLEVLAEHCRQHGTGEYGVLLHADGRPLSSNRIDWRWELTTRGAGLTTRLHDLRHHYASSLISSDCSIVAVQRALGHSKPSITLDRYGHLMPSDGERIRGAIDLAWNAAEDDLRTPTTMKAL